MKYYSQYGQDKYLNEELLKGKRDGFFVEVGADDGVAFSNTYFFEKELGWKGICVEPRKKAYGNLIKNRRCICENICVGKKNGVETFLEIDAGNDMLSGIYNAYDSRHVARINAEKKPDEKHTLLSLPCRTLADIFREHGVTDVDYLSIDTEGNELDVLAGIDFDAVKIKYITVENNYGGSRLHRLKATRVRRFLAKKGFSLLTTLKIDEVYEYTGVVRDGLLNEIKQVFNRSWLEKIFNI